MGTAAVFAVRSSLSPSRYFTTILGMTCDGFPGNLKCIAHDFNDKAKELRLLTKVKRRDWGAIHTVMQALVADSDGWLFIDNIRNAQWVSHSAIYDPAKGTLSHYTENLGQYVATVKIQSGT